MPSMCDCTLRLRSEVRLKSHKLKTVQMNFVLCVRLQVLEPQARPKNARKEVCI